MKVSRLDWAVVRSINARYPDHSRQNRIDGEVNASFYVMAWTWRPILYAGGRMPVADWSDDLTNSRH